MVMEFLDGRDLARPAGDAGRAPASRTPSTTSSRRARRSPRRTATASSTATSSRRTSSSPSAPNGTPLVKVLDFGISKVDSGHGRQPHAGRPRPWARRSTCRRSRCSRRAGVDHRTDIYALGISLYELLAGKQPFYADTLPPLCAEIFTGTPTPIRTLRADVPEGLAAVLEKAYARDRGAALPVGRRVRASRSRPARRRDRSGIIESIAKLAGLRRPRAGAPGAAAPASARSRRARRRRSARRGGDASGRASSAPVLGGLPQTTGPGVTVGGRRRRRSLVQGPARRRRLARRARRSRRRRLRASAWRARRAAPASAAARRRPAPPPRRAAAAPAPAPTATAPPPCRPATPSGAGAAPADGHAVGEPRGRRPAPSPAAAAPPAGRGRGQGPRRSLRSRRRRRLLTLQLAQAARRRAPAMPIGLPLCETAMCPRRSPPCSPLAPRSAVALAQIRRRQGHRARADRPGLRRPREEGLRHRRRPLQRADTLFHAPTIAVGLARAYAGLGKLVSAQEALQQGRARDHPAQRLRRLRRRGRRRPARAGRARAARARRGDQREGPRRGQGHARRHRGARAPRSA